MELNESFWTGRYQAGSIGWDAGGITSPLKAYFDQLEDKELQILIPGCGHAYEAEYLHHKGFTEVTVVDISPEPLRRFKRRVPSFPDEHLIIGDFFKMDGAYDRIIEQTFFSAIPPQRRPDYAQKCHELLKPGGKLVGVLFDDPLFKDHPPFGGSKEEYLPVFQHYFEIQVFERCYNSLPPRQGRELFMILLKRDVDSNTQG